jgi:hypothetical protein
MAGVAADPPASSPQRANDGPYITPTLSQTHVSFVGRQAELQHLKAAFEAAAGGQGALIMLVGEPGPVEPPGPENPEDDRLRLLSGIVGGLRHLGALHPLLLVMEDLHDADRGTLDLLVYLALSAFEQHARLLPTAEPAAVFVLWRTNVARGICLAQLGRMEEARTIVRPLLDVVESDARERTIANLVLLLEAAVVFEHRAAVSALLLDSRAWPT